MAEDTEEMRIMPICQTFELRKAWKDDQLLKRRNIAVAEEPTSLQGSNTMSPVPMHPLEIMFGMMNPNENIQFKATQAYRKIVSRESNPLIDHMKRLGVVPRCVEFLAKMHNIEQSRSYITNHTHIIIKSPSLQFEAWWVLANIASGTSEQHAAVLQEGVIPRLQVLLASPQGDVAEKAVWVLDKIAGVSAATRDIVLASGVLSDLPNLIKPGISNSLLCRTARAIGNLCRNTCPIPDSNLLKPALPTLAKLLFYNDKVVLAKTCWALSNLTDYFMGTIKVVFDTALINRLVQLLCRDESTILKPALIAVGNICVDNHQRANMVIRAGALTFLHKLLQHNTQSIVKEAVSTIATITHGKSEQIQEVIDANIMPSLLDLLRRGKFNVQKEAALAINHYTKRGTIAQLAKLVEMGALEPMCNLLNSKDHDTVEAALDGLSNILDAANEMGEVEKVAILIKEYGGLDRIEEVQGTSEQTAAILQESVIPRLQALLASPRIHVAEDAVRALGKIASVSAVTRDIVLASGVLSDLPDLIKPGISNSLLRLTAWAIGNLCCLTYPCPDLNLLKPALPTLAKLLFYNDKVVLAKTCWALSNLTEYFMGTIKVVFDTALINRLVQLLCRDESTILKPALIAVGNICVDNHQRANMVIRAGALTFLHKLLQHNTQSIVKEAVSTIATITNGNSEQIQKVIDANIMPSLLHLLRRGKFNVQKEAALAIKDYTKWGTIAQLAKLVEMGALKPMCNLLNSKDHDTVEAALDGLSSILDAANEMGEVEKVAILIKEYGGLDRIEALKTHANESINVNAYYIIGQYFSEVVIPAKYYTPLAVDNKTALGPNKLQEDDFLAELMGTLAPAG